MKRYRMLVSYGVLVYLGCISLGYANYATVRALKDDACSIYGETIASYYDATGSLKRTKSLVNNYIQDCVDPVYYDLTTPLQEAITIRGKV